jgi:hypothetical protein
VSSATAQYTKRFIVISSSKERTSPDHTSHAAAKISRKGRLSESNLTSEEGGPGRPESL